MAGIVHLRIVIAVFLVGGIAALMPYALSLFSEDVKPFPFGWVGGLSSIALVLWLSRGSNIARALLVIYACLGLAFYGYLALMVGSRSWTTAAFLGVLALISAYSLWALAFSQDVRVELARRPDTNLDEDPREAIHCHRDSWRRPCGCARPHCAVRPVMSGSTSSRPRPNCEIDVMGHNRSFAL